MAQQESKASSSGGVIKFTATGLQHFAGKAYSGKIAAIESKAKPKKGD